MQLKLKYIFSLLVMLITICSASGQTPAIDSLLKLIATATHDTSKILLNFQLAEKLRGYDLDRAIKHVEAGHAIGKNLDNDYYNAYYSEIKAECLFDMANYSEAQLHHDSAIVLYDRLIKLAIDDPKAVAKYTLGKTNCLIGKGLVAAKQYRYHESFQYYLEGIAGIENLPGAAKK